MKRTLAGVLALVLLLALGLSGCKSVSERIGEEVAEQVAGGAIGGDVEVTDDSVTIETDSGSTTIQSGSDKLPDGFPADFPVPDDATVGSSSSVKAEDDVNFYVGLTSGKSVSDLYDWYKAEFGSAGWEIKSDVRLSEGGSDTAMLAVEKGRAKGNVNLAPASGTTEIGIVLVVEGP